MDKNSKTPCVQTNWAVRFLCDCKKHEQGISIHKGIAHEITHQCIRLLSDHPICHEKRVAMQITVPPLSTNDSQKEIRIVGNSVITMPMDDKFLTEIRFSEFEQKGIQSLQSALCQLLAIETPSSPKHATG